MSVGSPTESQNTPVPVVSGERCRSTVPTASSVAPARSMLVAAPVPVVSGERCRSTVPTASSVAPARSMLVAAECRRRLAPRVGASSIPARSNARRITLEMEDDTAKGRCGADSRRKTCSQATRGRVVSR